MVRRWLRRGLLALGSLSIFLGVAYGSLIGYLAHREQVSPSTQQQLVLKGGQQIPLIQPTRVPVAVLPSPAHQPDQFIEPRATPPPPSPTVPPLLPPERITIPRIEVDWPVVLSTVDHLPQFTGVGWLMGSAFPGAPGNIVLYGHLGGPNGTFMRLHELQPGDEFRVISARVEHQYRVRSSQETTPDDVGVLAPTSTATATLITCSGPWDPVAQTNVRRLVVTADYVGP
jgi:sortase A